MLLQPIHSYFYQELAQRILSSSWITFIKEKLKLDEFLEDAQKLKIAGLISTESERAVEEETIHRSQNQKVINQTCIQENEVLNDSMIEDMSVTPVMNPNSQVAKLKLTNMDPTELDEKILEMISVVYGRFSCTVCAYTSDIC